MSEQNVELVRSLYEAFARRDNVSPFAAYDRDIEWEGSNWPELADLGFDHVYRGHEGVRKFWRHWLDAWVSIDFRLELRDAGDDVVALIWQQNCGRASGVVVEQVYAQVWTLRDGKVVRMRIFGDQNQALAAVGLAA